MVEMSQSGSAEGLGSVTGRGYSTVGTPLKIQRLERERHLSSGAQHWR